MPENPEMLRDLAGIGVSGASEKLLQNEPNRCPSNSMKIYNNGEEDVVYLGPTENMFMGSTDNPSIVRFSNRSEIFFSRKDGSQLKSSGFLIRNDSVICSDLVDFKITHLSKDKLGLEYQLAVDYFDNTIHHPKSIHTLYFRKVN